MKLKHARIDAAKTCGQEFILTEINARYNYVDNKRVGEPIGYTYTVILPQCQYDTLQVYIEGPCSIDLREEPLSVKFNGLELQIKWSRQLSDHIAGKAAGITLA